MISYEPFWETLKRMHMSQYVLIRKFGFSSGTLDSMRKNKSITLNTLDDICKLLGCEMSDVVILKPDDEINN